MATEQDKRVILFECPLDCLTLEETVKRCLFWIKEDPRPHFTAGMNANNIILMKKDANYKKAIYGADLIQADGVSIVWASRLMGKRLPERVNGTDLMNMLIREGSRLKLRVFLLGASEVVVSRVVEIISEKYPGLIVAGYRNGYFKKGQEAEVIQDIRESHPDILFIGMPSPFKEIWSYKHCIELNVPVIHGVGGSFDVFAGFIHRAPIWMQKHGLEWLWRLIMEPRKMWKRYLVNNTIFAFMLLNAMRKKYFEW